MSWLILASSSPRRADLLREWGIECRIIPAEVEENAPRELPVADAVQWNAQLKAAAVAELHPEAVVIGVDTLVAFQGEPLGKPRDLRAAVAMLRSLSGRTHEVFSGVCLIQAARERKFVERSEVTFREVSDAEIAGYFQQVNPLDKAGAYAAQEDPIGLIQKIEGSKTNVIGVPMERFIKELAAFRSG